jgi:hypothetical protein
MNGYACFGKYLTEPQFTDITQFIDRVDALPKAAERPIAVGQPHATSNATVFRQNPDFKAIVRADKPETVFGVVSKRYTLIQHREALQPVVDGIQELGLQFRGSLYTRSAVERDENGAASTVDDTEGARVNGLLVFQDPSFEFELLHDYREPMAVGLRFGNSVDGSQRLFGEGFGVNMVCSNYNMWGHLIGRASMKHLTLNAEKAVKEFKDLITKVQGAAAKIPGIMQRALDVRVETAQIGEVLYGLDMPQFVVDEVGTVDGIYGHLVGVQRDQYDDKGPNMKSLYDGLTNYFTHNYDGSLGRAEWAIERSGDLLKLDVSKILAQAEARRQKEADLKAKAAARQVA